MVVYRMLLESVRTVFDLMSYQTATETLRFFLAGDSWCSHFRTNLPEIYFQSFSRSSSRCSRFGCVSLLFSPLFWFILPSQQGSLAGVNSQPGSVLNQLYNTSYLTLADFDTFSDHPLINITKSPNYSVTSECIDSMQGNMDFRGLSNFIFRYRSNCN